MTSLIAEISPPFTAPSSMATIVNRLLIEHSDMAEANRKLF